MFRIVESDFGNHVVEHDRAEMRKSKSPRESKELDGSKSKVNQKLKTRRNGQRQRMDKTKRESTE